MLAARNEDHELKEKYVELLVATIIAGVILVVAQDVVEWLLEVDFDNPQGSNIPPKLIEMIGKVLPFVRYVGGAVIAIGLIISIPKLRLT